MASCIQASYEKDYVLEAKLNDVRFQEMKKLKQSHQIRQNVASMIAQKKN